MQVHEILFLSRLVLFVDDGALDARLVRYTLVVWIVTCAGRMALEVLGYLKWFFGPRYFGVTSNTRALGPACPASRWGRGRATLVEMLPCPICLLFTTT